MDGGLFRFLRFEDVPPEQFAPLAVRQPLHHRIPKRVIDWILYLDCKPQESR